MVVAAKPGTISEFKPMIIAIDTKKTPSASGVLMHVASGGQLMAFGEG